MGACAVSRFDQSTKDDLQRVAHLVADAARPETLRYFRQADLLTDNKDGSGFDPVTIADRAAEKAMRAVVAKERPQDGIIGEEFGVTAGTSGFTWVFDPIDGTRGYISGTPTWGILISVADESGPLFGIIDQPYIGERFVGGFGASTLVGPHGTAPLKTRQTTSLADAIVMTTFPEVGTKSEGRAFHKVAAQAKLTRYGMDCYGYALVATGQVDLVIEAQLQPYDIHAPIAVVQAAGGIVSNWRGGAAHHGGQVIAAANCEVYTAALAILQECLDD